MSSSSDQKVQYDSGGESPRSSPIPSRSSPSTPFSRFRRKGSVAVLSTIPEIKDEGFDFDSVFITEVEDRKPSRTGRHKAISPVSAARRERIKFDAERKKTWNVIAPIPSDDSLVFEDVKSVEYSDYPYFGFAHVSEEPPPFPCRNVISPVWILQKTMSSFELNKREKRELNVVLLSKQGQQILLDLFWLKYITEYMNATLKRRKMEEKRVEKDKSVIIERMSMNYVKIFAFLTVKEEKFTSSIKDIRTKNQKIDQLLDMFTEGISRAVYRSFFTIFPDSRHLFDTKWRKTLLKTISKWFYGVEFEPKMEKFIQKKNDPDSGWNITPRNIYNVKDDRVKSGLGALRFLARMKTRSAASKAKFAEREHLYARINEILDEHLEPMEGWLDDPEKEEKTNSESYESEEESTSVIDEANNVNLQHRKSLFKQIVPISEEFIPLQKPNHWFEEGKAHRYIFDPNDMRYEKRFMDCSKRKSPFIGQYIQTLHDRNRAEQRQESREKLEKQRDVYSANTATAKKQKSLLG